MDPDELARSGLDGFRDLWTAAAPILDALQAPTVAPDVAAAGRSWCRTFGLTGARARASSTRWRARSRAFGC